MVGMLLPAIFVLSQLTNEAVHPLRVEVIHQAVVLVGVLLDTGIVRHIARALEHIVVVALLGADSLGVVVQVGERHPGVMLAELRQSLRPSFRLLRLVEEVGDDDRGTLYASILNHLDETLHRRLVDAIDGEVQVLDATLLEQRSDEGVCVERLLRDDAPLLAR